jgi:hypothetical protein
MRGRFGAQGRVWRTIDGGATWTNITGNLPDSPMYSIELDPRGPGAADDRIWVGSDVGVYETTNLGTTWSEFGASLPNVQSKDLEYIPGLGILSIGTHGRGMWQISVPDVTPPTVFQSNLHYATAPHRFSFRFNEDVAATLALADVTLVNLTTSQTIPSGSMALAYDRRTDTATLTFPGFAQGVLPDGRYQITIGPNVADRAGNAMTAPFTTQFTFLRGDANGDGRVNLDDFNILAQNFGQAPRDFTQGDFNYSGNVNLDDFNILAQRFGQVVAPARGGGSNFGLGADDEGDDEPILAS